VWGIDRASGPVEGPAREASLRTVVLSEAIFDASSVPVPSSMGIKAPALVSYYPKHAILNSEELDEVTGRHFTTACRDLFVDGEGPELVRNRCENVPSVLRPVRGAPGARRGGLFARVNHADGPGERGACRPTGSENGNGQNDHTRHTVQREVGCS